MGLRQRGSVIGNYATASSNSASGIWTGKEAYTLQKKGTWQIPPTFSLSSSAGTVNEGASVNFTLTTTGIPNGTVIPYTLSGANVTTTDSANNILTGNFVISNGSSTVSFNANADVTLEGTEIIQMVAAGKTANVTINDTSYPTDAQFPYTTLLLHGDGTNNSQNNTFLDSSTNNATITRNGNATQGSFSPYGSNWSNYFTGSSTNLSLAANASLALGTGDFTIEMWVYNQSTTNRLISYATTTSPILYLNASNFLLYENYGVGAVLTSSIAVPLNTWAHIAVCRSTGVTKIFINGVQGASGADTNNWGQNGIHIGTDLSTTYMTGYLSSVRVIKGTALYTTAFTPPTSPLTAVSGTSLLTCQSNQFIDKSTNAFAITTTGSPSVQRFSPFSPTSAYNANTYGGTAYFDGTGDYLTVPYISGFDIPLNTAFTLECWVYTTTNNTFVVANRNWPYGGSGPTWAFYLNSGITPSWGIAGTGASTYEMITSSISGKYGGWNHYVWTRDGGNVCRIFVNGIQGASRTDGQALTSGSGAVYIGVSSNLASPYATGNMSNMRFVSGMAVYTGNFTPPSAPLSTSGSSAPYASTANVNTTFASANTALLCNFTNAGIYDGTMISDIETIDGAKLSTSVSKFGGSSMFFDGGGDYISLKNPGYNYTFYAGNWTIETWIYPTSTSTTQTIFMQYGNSVDVIKLYFNGSSGAVSYQLRGTNQSLISADSAGSLITLNTWSHIAMVRDSTTTIKIFINGTLALTATIASSTTFNEGGSSLYAESPVIGAKLNATTDYFVGYMDDFRITNGYARYTTNFTVPTSAFGGI